MLYFLVYLLFFTLFSGSYAIPSNINNKISSKEINFISYGDWGHKNIHQKQVADQIYNFTQKYDSKFNIVLGDNFYETGVESIEDKKWKEVYKDVYKNNNPWFSILGNHDYYGNASAEILYTGKDNRWIMPSNNYVMIYKNIKFIMIDTQLLDTQCTYIQDNITNNIIKYYIYNFIENELKNGNQYKIIAGHAGIYGAGEHGNCYELEKYLLPLLEKYNVSTYLHGHEHLLQHNKINNINFFGCGTASKVSKTEKINFESEYTQKYFNKYGFCLHTIRNNNIINRFIDKNGNIIYEYTNKL